MNAVEERRSLSTVTDTLSDLVLLVMGLELKYGRLDSMLLHSDSPAGILDESEELIRNTKRVFDRIGRLALNIDRLLPRLLVGIGSAPAGRNCPAFTLFRAELLRLWKQPEISIPEWQQFARSVPFPVKLEMASTADRVAKRFPFLLQEYQLQRQLS
jgi:hypothetical protein